MSDEYGKGLPPTEEEFEKAGYLTRMGMWVDAMEHRQHQRMIARFKDNGDGTVTFRRHIPWKKNDN